MNEIINKIIKYSNKKIKKMYKSVDGKKDLQRNITYRESVKSR